MALKIRPEAKTKIVEILERELPEIRVDNGYFVDRFSAFLATYAAQGELPKSGPTRDAMEAYVDDHPLVEFVLQFIRGELADNRGYLADETQRPLSEIEGYGDAKALASRLLDNFEKLPRRYDVTVQIPRRFFPEGILEEGAYSLGSQTRLSPPDLIFREKYPLSHPNPLRSSRAKGGGVLNALMIGDPKWKEGEMCFTKSIEGFVGIWGGGTPMDGFEEGLESFLGLGLAKRIFSYEYRFDNSKEKPIFHVHEICGDNVEFFTSLESNEGFSEVFRHIKSLAFSPTYLEENKIPWIKSVISEINKLYMADANHELLLASKWFFDSYKDREPALRYVRQMTCLEILLGRGINLQKASLSEIISNRLAYLIGSDVTDRDSIVRKFRDIYSLRSRILHQGKHRLRSDEQSLLSSLTDYCSRAIDSESKLLIGK